MVYRSPLSRSPRAAWRWLRARLQVPRCCLLCGGDCCGDIDICEPCQARLPWLGPGCEVCAEPLADSDTGARCGRCLVDPPHFGRTHACWRYRPPLARIVAAFKYQRVLSYGRSLSLLMAEQLVSTYYEEDLPDLVTAVPLHHWRYLRRGFNHSEALARTLATRLRLPYRHLVRRHRPTPTQQSLSAELRRRNLRGAFNALAPLNGETVALVDDVLTTGSTADEVSKTLLAAGAGAVHVWCLARTAE